MKTIAITGLSGVIGTTLLERATPSENRIINLFHSRSHINNPLIRKHIRLDLLKRHTIERSLFEAQPDKIIHLAGITHIDACEQDRRHGKNGVVWKINVDATEEISKFCKKYKIPIIYMSTECVFDGENDFYRERAPKRPKNWYGHTKNKAENLLLDAGIQATIIRAVITYHKRDNGRTLFGTFYRRLKSGNLVHAVTDQLITPAYTRDVTRALEYCMLNNKTGIYHISPNTAITPHDLAVLIAQYYGFNSSLIQKTTLPRLYGNQRASLRLKHACLHTTRPLITSPHIKTPFDVFRQHRAKNTHQTTDIITLGQH